MVRFKDLVGDSARKDLGKEVEALRLKVALMEQGYLPPDVDDPLRCAVNARGRGVGARR